MSELGRMSPVVPPTFDQLAAFVVMFNDLARRLHIPFCGKVKAPFTAFYNCSLELCLELKLLLC
jgi:hypothetical protein